MLTKEIPQTLKNSIFTWCPDLPIASSPIIAGGFIRAFYAGENPNDMDLYFTNETCFKVALVELGKWGWIITSETARAVTLKKDGKVVQLISFVYGLAEQIISNFDFTICAAAVYIWPLDYSYDSLLYLHDDFFEHLASRLLVFQGSMMPLASLKRAVKYIRRGYHICDENLIKLTDAITRQVNFDDERSVAQHIEGMDPEGNRRIRIID